MTHLSPRAIEAGAKAIIAAECDDEWYPFETSSRAEQELARRQMRAVLTVLEAEGMVVVPKHITNKMICAVIDATDKKHSPLSCTEFWDVALQAAQGGDDAGQ